jgi:hypothetical protein
LLDLSAQEVIEASIDLDLADLTPEEVEGGFRTLCGAMLLRAAQELGTVGCCSKYSVRNKQAARGWLFKQEGLITFTEACEACNIHRQAYLDGIVEYTDRLRANPRAIGGVKNRWATGRRLADADCA